MARKSKEIAQGIQESLKERMAKYNDLVNKHLMLEKELVKSDCPDPTSDS